MSAEPLLKVDGLKKHFPIRRGLFPHAVGYVYAVDGISFSVGHGEALGLVGESGCGKSTAAKCILRLIAPTAGRVVLDGADITALPPRALRPYRRQMQVVFQDPFASLNPRLKAGDIVGEPLSNFGVARGKARTAMVADLFGRVGLRRDQMANYPHEFSGGQRQRLGIARALALNPKLIVCDEPVSALDVSVQAQVINLLMDLQREFNLSYLFVAHDLAVVQHISHRVAVMYLGKIVELAPTASLFAAPQHPYTEALLAAVPTPDPAAKPSAPPLTGDVPSPANPPPGCRFSTRCPYAENRCRAVEPPLQDLGGGHFVACHLRQPVPSPRGRAS